MRGSSSTAHSTVINSTASTEKLDRNSTDRQTSTGRHMESASTGLDGAQQELDRLDKARQARPRQRPRQRLDGASTEPRQLDSSTARAQIVQEKGTNALSPRPETALAVSASKAISFSAIHLGSEAKA